jgi:DNA-binding beta-propeller fold protein YncE
MHRVIRHAKAVVAVSVVLSTLLLGVSLALALQTHTKGDDLEAVPSGAFAFQGLAVDQSGGEIYAVDQFDPNTFAHGTLHRFQSDGSYDDAFATATASFSETLSQPMDVAVDNTGGSSDGTVYVANSANNRIDAIDSSGAPVASFGSAGQINGVEDSPGDPDTVLAGAFSFPCGVAVDQSNANLFVSDQNNNRVWIFDSSGAYLARIADSALNGPCGLAFSSTGDLYVRNANDGKVTRFARKAPTEFEFASTFYAPGDNGTPDDPSDDLAAATDVAVDTATDHVYVDRGDRISEYDSSGLLVSTFGQDALGGSSAGIAIDTTAFALYASAGNRIATFGPLVTVADVTTGSATDVIDTAATLHGSLDPVGIETTECRFEWGTDTTYGNSAPCAEGDAFNAAEEVSAELTGLTAATTYHYRLVVANGEGENRGQDRSFVTVGPPTLKEVSGPKPVIFVSDVSARAATLNAELNPGGAATSWHFEYVEEDVFQASGFANATKVPVPAAQMDAGTAFLPISTGLSGLEPGTRYRYRLIASNLAGPLVSPERGFRTDPLLAPPAPGQFPGQNFLPDGRVWEMVSPPEKNGGGVSDYGSSTAASPDGERVAYLSTAGFGDTQGSGGYGSVQYVASRGAGGWTSHALTPTPDPMVNQGFVGTAVLFSRDLAGVAIEAFDLPYVSGDVFDASNIYRGDAAGGPLLPVTSPQEGGFTHWELGPSAFIGGDPGFHHIFFYSPQQLTPSAPLFTKNVWEWEEGTLRLAGILPDGSVPPGGSHPAFADGNVNLLNRDTASVDGSRVLFRASPTGASPTQLYMRRGHTETVWISEAEGTGVTEPENVLYQAASSDLDHVAFTTSSQLTAEDPGGDGRALYLYTDSPDPESEENLEFVYRGQALNVPGMSEDGLRGFFYDESVQKLLRWDDGGTHMVFERSASSLQRGEAREDARVSADGTVIAFLSNQQLTEEELGPNPSNPSERAFALYIYDAKTDELRCASCPPSGAQTSGHTWVFPFSRTEGFELSAFLPNFLTSDGRRAYFSTPDALVPGDVNGRYDAYQYDVATAEPHLLSSGRSDRGSWYANISPDGDDAFFITHEALSAHDVDTAKDLYDARVGGGLPEPAGAPPGCEGDACQPPPTELRDPTPASAAFNGPGDREQRAARRKRCRRVAKQRRAGQKQRRAAKRCRAARGKRGARR